MQIDEDTREMYSCCWYPQLDFDVRGLKYAQLDSYGSPQAKEHGMALSLGSKVEAGARLGFLCIELLCLSQLYVQCRLVH